MNAEKYLAHLESITKRQEDVIRKIDSSTDLPPVFVFIYKNWPEDGLITGFTFGLSAAKNENWKFGRPELMISIESSDEAWPLAIAFLAERLRGFCPFCYGNTINFNEKISDESNLDAFLVFAPLYLKNEQKSVDLGEYVCNIAGMYPIYRNEMNLIDEIGLEAFWHLDEWDPLNPKRPEIKKRN